MVINILHMYHDIMNLYGESGNIKSLEYNIRSQGMEVHVDRSSIGDIVDFQKYDFVYMGSSTKDNQLIVLDDIKRHAQSLKEYINGGGFVLATGNSLELFGKNIDDKKALNIFEYEAYSSDKRIVGDYIADDTTFGKIIAFQNRGSVIKNNSIPWFDKGIGVKSQNFLGSYLIGPLLVRNPRIARFITEALIKSKDNGFVLKDFDFEFEKKARKQYMTNYYGK